MGTHYQGTRRQQQALNAYIALMRAAQSLTARLSARRAGDGLTACQLGVLETLLHLGPLCQKELAAKLLTTGGNITAVLDNLERDGMVRRVRSSEDRRYVAVHLTPGGRARIARVFPRHAADIATEFAVLSADEQEQVRRLCRSLGRQESTRSTKKRSAS